MSRAYSYVRFSSAEQRKGDSLRRQLRAAQDYCALHKLDLDTDLTLHDLGVSGFRGDNLIGALGAFLQAVALGQVEPGSTLIVESVDRITRQDAWTALPTLQAIIGAGITLVTLSPERTINTKALTSNPFLLMEILLYMIRANEESATKSRRARGTWEGRRAKAAQGAPQRFGKLPSWVKLVDGRFVVDDGRANVIRGIAAAVLAGKGQLAIAKDLNFRGVPPLGRAKIWHKGNVYALLRQPSLIGRLVPHTWERANGRTVRTALDPVEDYFPAILDRETWDRVQDMLDARAPQRGAHVGRPLSNMFAGMLRCHLCGGAVHVKQDGRKNRYLVCTASGAGGCAGVRARYESVEEWFFIEIESVIRQAPRGQDLDAELDDARAAALGLGEVVANIVEALQEAPGSRALTAKLQQVEAEEAEAHAALRAVVDRAERAQSRIVRARLEALHAAFAADPFDRAAANLALRQAVDRIVLEPGALFLHWRHGGLSDVPFSTEPRKRRASPRR
jgi:DNA invertase Pin-like site-specific DNA recombinase